MDGLCPFRGALLRSFIQPQLKHLSLRASANVDLKAEKAYNVIQLGKGPARGQHKFHRGQQRAADGTKEDNYGTDRDKGKGPALIERAAPYVHCSEFAFQEHPRRMASFCKEDYHWGLANW
eukprot:1155833-Pelagomonas_calceolata.AAC.10